MTLPNVLRVRCHFCSKQKPEHQVRRVATGQAICEYCLDWHYHALDFLGGAVPRGCQECGVTFEVLRNDPATGEVRMYVVPKDGIYQLLCAACAAVYLPKRADLYVGTKFGRETLKIL